MPTAEKAALLIDWTNRLRTGAAVDHASAYLLQVQENKYYADLAGTRTTQQRVRLQPGFEAMGAGADTFDSMASIAPPVGRGWEYLTDGSYDWDDEIEQVPELLAEKLKAPSVEAGSYDLVIHPSNLWLTIHESIGHATELDRALGYEANYAGHVVRDVRQAQHAPVRLPGHERHRRPHRRARAGDDRATTTRACRPRAGTSSRTACWSATSSTGRWAP